MGFNRERFKQEVKHSLWRTISVLATLLVFGGIGFGIYSSFKKPNQSIVAQKGSTVQVTQINKTSRFFIPFIEAFVEQRSNNDMNTGIRGGIRVEF